MARLERGEKRMKRVEVKSVLIMLDTDFFNNLI